MEPILSQVAVAHPRNVPHDLQARLYREIGISAVAAALEIYDMPATKPTAPEMIERPAPRQAA